MSDFVLIKHGLYCRPNYAGYTSSLKEAGRFSLEEAESWSECKGASAKLVSMLEGGRAQEVRDLREKTGMSMQDAKAVFTRRDRLEELERVRSSDNLLEKVTFLLNQYEASLNTPRLLDLESSASREE